MQRAARAESMRLYQRGSLSPVKRPATGRIVVAMRRRLYLAPVNTRVV